VNVTNLTLLKLALVEIMHRSLLNFIIILSSLIPSTLKSLQFAFIHCACITTNLISDPSVREGGAGDETTKFYGCLVM
jgi:hypothetical protein